MASELPVSADGAAGSCADAATASIVAIFVSSVTAERGAETARKGTGAACSSGSSAKKVGSVSIMAASTARCLSSGRHSFIDKLKPKSQEADQWKSWWHCSSCSTALA